MNMTEIFKKKLKLLGPLNPYLDLLKNKQKSKIV